MNTRISTHRSNGLAALLLRLIVFLGLLLFAPLAEAQVLDALAERLVDEINGRVLKTQVDANTRQLQVAATKVLVRGSEGDWEDLMGSALGVAGTNPSTTRPSTGSPSAQGISSRYLQAVESNVRTAAPARLPPPPAKPTYLNLAVAGRPLEIAVNPWQGEQRKALVSGISTVEADGNRATREYVLLLQLQGASPLADQPGGGGGAWRRAMGGRLAVISAGTKQIAVDNERDAEVVEGAFGVSPGISSNFTTLYVYDFDKDGLDECVYLSNRLGQGWWNQVHVLRKIQPGSPYKHVYYGSIANFDGLVNELDQSERQFVQRAGVLVDANGLTITEWLRRWEGGNAIKTHRLTFSRGVLNPSVKEGPLERK